MAQGDPMKWHMPGWRIEQRFAPGVLIGNWGEERYTVSCPVNSAAMHVHALADRHPHVTCWFEQHKWVFFYMIDIIVKIITNN